MSAVREWAVDPLAPLASDSPGRYPPGFDVTGHGGGGPAPVRIVVGFGFWIFLLSDFVMFSALFAAYAVLEPHRAGGPGPRELFDISGTALQTACLLLSSFACGIATVAVSRKHLVGAQVGLLLTGLLGLGFLLLELREFMDLIGRGAGPERSAFLSAFYTLVGCHGAHVTVGLLWLGTLMAQFPARGFRESICHRYLCFSLFWHALDIVWVGLFSLIYLVGVNVGAGA